MGLLALALRHARQAPVKKAERPLEVQIVTLAAPAPKVAPPSEKAAPSPPQPLPVRRPSAAQPAQTKAPAESSQVLVPLASTAPAGPGPTVAPDAPRATAPGALLPRLSLSAPGLLAGPDEDRGTGRTLRNGPGAEVDPVAMRDYQAEKAQRSMQETLTALAADARTRNGTDPYFGGLANALHDGFQGPVQARALTGKEQLADAVGTYTETASAFARTGNPGVSKEYADQVMQQPLALAAQREFARGNEDQARWLMSGAQLLAGNDALKASAGRARKSLLLELVQDASGALAGLQVLERSGDDTFDDFVVHRVRKVVRDRGDVPDGGVSGAPLGFKSVWRFTLLPPRVGVELLRMSPLTAPPG
ncbi:MAG: hypothetical protein K1X89_19355 [Myxococcaceae bacterium]|nr:hypothetical protein [Myxococcaceae bacterium]